MALTQVTTDGVKDDAVTLAKQAAGTDGQVITYDASGNPKAIGPGTDGQVLTSAGAGAEPAFENAVSEGTQVKSTGESGGTKFLREDGDGTSSWQTVNTTPEGTAILSTRESGGTKFLREDGDGTSSWQAVPAGGVDGISSSADANAITIDSSEHVIVGGTTVSGVHAGNQDFVVGNTSNTQTGMALNCASGGYISIVMSDGQGDKNKGLIAYNHADDTFKLVNDPASGYDTLVLQSDHNVKVGAGNLVIGTSGKGVDFAATSDGSGTDSSEVFDDYEEGTWTPSMDGLSNTPTFYNLVGKYVKIGEVVKCQGFIQIGATNPTFTTTGNVFKVSGLPYTAGGSGYLRVIGNVAWQGITWVGASYSTYGHADDTIIQASIDDGGTKTVFRTMGQADYYMGELRNLLFHDNSWIL